MTILHIVDSLGRGGMENGVVNLAEGLGPRGYSFAVIALTRRGELADHFESFGPIESLDRAPGFSMTTARRLRQAIARHRPDIIHTHNLGPLLYTFLARAGIRRGTTILHGEHAELGPDERRGRRFLLRRLLLRWPHRLHTVSTGMTAQFTSLGLNPGGRMWSLVNGVDTRFYQPAPDPPAARTSVLREFGVEPGPDLRLAGIVGRFDPHKRHRELLQAMAIDEHSPRPQLRHWHLLLIGDGGTRRDEILQQIADHPAAARIHHAGFRPRPRELYQALDLLLLPSSREGLSNALLEAMACGVPCLSHRSCGAGEVIIDGETGWIRDWTGAEQIQRDWSHLSQQSAQTIISAGRAARQRAEQNFSIDSMLERYQAVYG